MAIRRELRTPGAVLSQIGRLTETTEDLEKVKEFLNSLCWDTDRKGTRTMFPMLGEIETFVINSTDPPLLYHFTYDRERTTILRVSAIPGR